MIAYRKLINKHKTVLTEKEESYQLQFESKDSNFYRLPKFHKSAQIASKCAESSTQIIQVTDITDLKLRPIIAGHQCLTQT